MAPPPPPSSLLAPQVAERLRTPGLVALGAALVLFGATHTWRAPDDPDQGLGTTCRHFLEMPHDQQLAVMSRSHVLSSVTEARIRYFKDACRSHPGALDQSINALW